MSDAEIEEAAWAEAAAIWRLVTAHPAAQRAFADAMIAMAPSEVLQQLGLPASRDAMHARKSLRLASRDRSDPEAETIYARRKARYPQTFIVPLAYLLRRYRAITCSPGRFQVYQHRIFPTAQVPVIPGVMVLPQPALLKDLTRIGLIYTGITRRDWRTRLKEHLAAARKSSALLFHQALRGDLIAIASVEHEILRVGLTTDQAMDIE